MCTYTPSGFLKKKCADGLCATCTYDEINGKTRRVRICALCRLRGHKLDKGTWSANLGQTVGVSEVH